MARIRTIKPEFFTSPTVAGLTHRARLTFIGLWTYVDDDGRGWDDARLVKAAIWPLDDEITHAHVAEDLDDLAAGGLLERWSDADSPRPLIRVRSFLEHQRISHPKRSVLPPSPEESAATSAQPSPDHPALQSPPEDCPSPPEDCQSPPEDVQQEVEVEVEGEREVEQGRGSREGVGTVTVAPHPVDNVAAAAPRLVNRTIKGLDELPDLIEALETKYGPEVVTRAVASLKGRYEWPSDLRKALDRDLAPRPGVKQRPVQTLADAVAWAEERAHHQHVTEEQLRSDLERYYPDHVEGALLQARAVLAHLDADNPFEAAAS